MKNKFKRIIKKLPLIPTVARIILTFLEKKLTFLKDKSFIDSKKYWETRYATGGISGPGSYGKPAKFKAEIINSFVKNNEINSVIDFGCGDGNQLSLADYPNYTGLDVSQTAIKLCMERFKKDKTKSFFLYDSRCFKDNRSIFKADLALSLDVIFHLIEDDIFELYMKHLFSASGKFVIIYSSDTNIPSTSLLHCKNRQFTKLVETNLPEWKLMQRIKYNFTKESISSFFIYKRVK